jgi:hypothetical protein
MDMSVAKRLMSLGVGIGLVALTGGCAGTGEVVTLDVREARAAPKAGPETGRPAQPVKVAVAAFDDARQEKGRLGVRTHLWGGTTYFAVPGRKTGEVVAETLADYLRRKGWQVWVAKPGTDAGQGQPDVTLTGRIQEFSADAKSRVGSTRITVTSKLVVEGVNAVDGSRVHVRLDGSSAESVVWFDPDDVRALVQEVLKESVDKFVANTKIENRGLRLR